MKDTITYKVGESLYINLTNRCCNNCAFCVRNHADGVDGYFLWLSKEPSVEEILAEIISPTASGPPPYSKGEFNGEVVFCGFGEPTYRLDDMIIIAKEMRKRGIKTRVNTNGLGSLINGRDVSAEIAKNIDIISISLNATTAEGYQKICKSVYGEDAFPALLSFAEGCVKAGGNVILSVVDTIGADEIEKSRKIAEAAGAKFRIRKYIP